MVSLFSQLKFNPGSAVISFLKRRFPELSEKLSIFASHSPLSHHLSFRKTRIASGNPPHEEESSPEFRRNRDWQRIRHTLSGTFVGHNNEVRAGPAWRRTADALRGCFDRVDCLVPFPGSVQFSLGVSEFRSAMASDEVVSPHRGSTGAKYCGASPEILRHSFRAVSFKIPNTKHLIQVSCRAPSEPPVSRRAQKS